MKEFDGDKPKMSDEELESKVAAEMERQLDSVGGVEIDGEVGVDREVEASKERQKRYFDEIANERGLRVTVTINGEQVVINLPLIDTLEEAYGREASMRVGLSSNTAVVRIDPAL